MVVLRQSLLLDVAPSRAHCRPFVAARRPQAGSSLRASPVTAAAQPDKPAAKKKSSNPLAAYKPPSREGASLRAEAEAPFRSLRLFLFGAGVASASLATLFGLPSLIGALGGAPNAKPLVEALQDLAINIGGLATCGFLVYRDLQAREKQMARLMREDELGACQLELANGRLLRLAQLRGFSRVVLIAGSPRQVAASLAAAEPFKQQLQAGGVLVVTLPFVADTPAAAAASTSSGASGDAASAEAAAAADAAAEAALLAPPGAEDIKWRASAIRMDDWRRWFEQQAGMANKTLAQGLYISLRLDGRVRGSGTGSPPWAIMAAQLPPTEGFFGGLFDGMDGKV